MAMMWKTNRWWGLSQGIMGRKREGLSPTLTAVGPNTYLTPNDFLKMLGVALVAHVIIFTVAALMPREHVTNIPVRALSFKLGDDTRIAATESTTPSLTAMPTLQPIPATAPAEIPPAPAADAWRAAPLVTTAATPTPVTPLAQAALPPAIAPTPQQHVRQVGAPTPQAIAGAMANLATSAGQPAGSISGQLNQPALIPKTEQAERARYELEISAWIQRHKFYPADAGGREGRAVVRMRIDRAGNVRYYAIEQSSGMVALDSAALDMIRRANPVPAVPTSYQSGNLVEFLIPITFKAPI